jgi:two-component system, sensor histidine kinase PdtaS
MASRPNAALSLARALIDISGLPLLLLDGEMRVVSASRSFCEAFDVPRNRAEGRYLAQLGGGEWDIPQLSILLEAALADDTEHGAYETDLVRPDMETRRLVLNVRRVDYDDSQNARILLAIQDVTETQRVDRLNIALLLEKDDQLRDRAVLLQEMQHRIANSLQIIASVLLLKARTVQSEESRRHLRDAHDRVMSVAAVQRHLEFTLGDVEVGAYLTKLCGSLASSMIRDGRPLTLEVRANDATVSSHTAVSLGLIVTELVINALKHAFPDGRGGAIVVAYRVEQAQWTMSVADDGVGRSTAVKPGKPGLGTSVVEALARQLGARVVISDASPGTLVALVPLV